jgi:hypothetical protein
MTTLVQHVANEELFSLAGNRSHAIRAFLEWAKSREKDGPSMYLANRHDIDDARQAASMFQEKWWGVVVFTCFGSLRSTSAVKESILATPIESREAERWLSSVSSTRLTVGHHRIQQGLTGARKALVAACQHSQLIHAILQCSDSFDDRYHRLLAARLDRWGRTTCFDLLLRTGALGVCGKLYEPDIAYLVGSTGPSAGFDLIWGRSVSKANGPWCEGVLQAWHRNWPEVAKRTGTTWSGRPYTPGDLENALCIYQERSRHKCAVQPRAC